MFLPESRHEEMFFDINLRRGSKETERELTISGSNWSPGAPNPQPITG